MDGWLPGKGWLGIVSRLLDNIDSPDGSLDISYSSNGINLQVDRTRFPFFVLGKITAVGTSSATCNLYRNGISEEATETGVTVDVPTAWLQDPPPNMVWLTVRVVPPAEGTTGSATYEAVNTGISNVGQSVAETVSLTTDTHSLVLTSRNVYLDYDTAGRIEISPDTGTGSSPEGILLFDTGTGVDVVTSISLSSSTLTSEKSTASLYFTTDLVPKLSVHGTTRSGSSFLQFDTSTEIDLAAESQISTGGYLQTRLKKVKLVLTTDSPPKLQLAASSNYGSWVNGPQVGECT